MIATIFAGVLLAAAGPVSVPPATPNHVVVAVSDMPAARRAFAAAGFRDSDEERADQTYTHAIVPFADGTYLELLRAPRRTPDDAQFYDFARRHEGAAIAAGYEVADISAQRRALVRAGFAMEPLDRQTYWTDLSFAESQTLLGPFFYIQYVHNTIAYFHRRFPALLKQTNGATGLRGIDLAVEPGQGAARSYAAAGLLRTMAIEDGAGDPRIVLIRIATSSPALRGTTIAVEGCRIAFE